MSGLENFDIQAAVIDSIVETFDTMVSMEIELSDSEPPDITGAHRLLATVNFAGSIAGIFNIQVTSEFARLMTANMLDIEPEEVEGEGEAKDLLAEISNIVGGSLKSTLNDNGHPCVLSTPSITYGADFTIKSLNMERFERFAFKHHQNYFFVEVGLKAQQTVGNGDGSAATGSLDQLKQIDVKKINALDLKIQVPEAVIDVFDTMLSVQLETADSATSERLEGVCNVGSVSFAGDVTGMVSIYVGDDFLRRITADMLEMEVEEITGDEEIRDTLGEVGNIVGGNLKSAFTDAGLSCVLSTPAFTTGTDFKLEALNMEKYERFTFRCDENLVFAEVGVKISELVQTAEQNGDDIHHSAGDNAVKEDGAGTQQKENGEKPDSAEIALTPDTLEQPKASKAPVKSESEEPQEPTARLEEKASPSKQPRENPEDVDLNILLDIPLEIKVELGRTKMPIHELLNLASGSAVKLLKLEGDPVDILANDTLIARGEVVVQNEKYGIRVIEITSRMDRIRNFGL